jgi:hypothetical protein
MNKITWALASLLALLIATPATAQVDISVQGVTPLSDVRLDMSSVEDVKVTIKNIGQTLSQAIKVKVTIRTYTNILVYADSITRPGLASQMVDTVSLKGFDVPEAAFYAVTATVTVPNDVNVFNNTLNNPRVDYQFDAAAMGIVTPLENDQKLQKVTFNIRGKFRSNNLHQEVNVPARAVIRRCSDSALVFQSNTYIPELPADTVTVQVQFPSQQGIYDVRKLSPGCYKLTLSVNMLSDFNHSNDAVSITFNVASNTLANDVMIDTINSIKNKTIKPDEAMPLSFFFGNVGLNAQPSTPVHVVIRDENGSQVYHEQSTLTDWISGETRPVTFNIFKTSIGGTYTLRAYTSLPTDEYRYNDTLTRTITVEHLFTIKVDSIILPVAGQTFEVGSDFIPRVRYSWTGNAVPSGKLKGEFVISSISGGFQQQFSVDLTGFSDQVRTIEAAFLPNGAIKKLTRNTYLASANAIVDDKLVSSIVGVPFHMTYAHDVRIDSFISPLAHESYPLGPIAIAQSVANIGMFDESNVTFEATIAGPEPSEVYHETTSATLGVSNRKVISLPNFIPTQKGMHGITFKASVADEGDITDNNQITLPFHVGSRIDPAFIAAVSPMAGEQKQRGVNFQPRAMLAWFGNEQVDADVQVKLSITKCSDNSEVFSTQDQVVGTWAPGEAIRAFSSSSTSGVEIKDLPVGCYHATFIATHPEDLYHEDDTLVVPFSIEDDLAVNEQSTTSFGIRNIIQNGDELRVSLGQVSSAPVSYRILNVSGIQCLSAREALRGTEIIIPSGSLSTGSYILEIRQGDRTSRSTFNYVK